MLARAALLLLAALPLAAGGCPPSHREPAAAPRAVERVREPAPVVEPAPARVDFDAQIRPILTARCQPCHFPGGKMYVRLPFDRPQTVRQLGTRLFTRIHDEKEQALLRAFLAQPAEPAASLPTR
jgi:hypothetical protein